MEKDEKRAAKEAAKQDKARRNALEAAELQEKCGDVVISSTFKTSVITIYSKGYVSVSGGMGLFKGTPEKLQGIDFVADITKKSGLGRGAAAVLTGGLNLLSSNKRGDAYLTIVTDRTTHSLRVEAPYATDMKNGHAIAPAGQALLNASGIATVTVTNDSDIAGQLEKLSNLHKKGILSDDEFAAAKSKLLG